MKDSLTQRQINETMRQLEVHTRHINCIRLHKSTTLEHRNKIVEICNWLIDNDYSFITEAKFVKGGRADIIVLEEGIALEILHTEELKSFNKKDYPIPTYPIRTNELWKGL